MTDRNYQTVRVRQARREGVTRVNQWLNPRNEAASSNLVDKGWIAVGAERLGGKARPVVVLCAAAGSHAEGLRRKRDHAVGEELGTNPAERDVVNMGTAARPAVSPSFQVGNGQVRCQPVVAQRGGAAVVVRGRESRLHGEGRQLFRSTGTGMPGGRW